ncbi:PP2C family serine/threonine-protein phosphatase [Pontibacillus salicampi]|uniref:PP2C family serine/threonine-protein phosphatase n=1 Tax=Pontibacillus salicampi TaxID=1449801 RepID=A0ABV6LSU3_9BACI
MIRNHTVHYQQGVGQENEDAYVIDEQHHVYAVIDGATGLDGLPGKLAADALQQGLKEGKAEERLLDRVLESNRSIGELNTKEEEILPKEERTSCGLAAIKIWETGQVEYVHTGDCMIFLEYGDSQIRSITFDHLAPLDTLAIKRLQVQWAERLAPDEHPNTWPEERIKATLRELRDMNMPRLKENRSKMNTRGGYSIIDGTEDVAQFIEHGTFYLHNVTRILMLSDGLQLPTHKAQGQNVWQETAAFAFEHGLDALQSRINELEANDPACYDYPRLKRADDKTGILLDVVG